MGGSRFRFPDTSWKVVLSAKDRDSEKYRENLEKLVSMYWKPVYVYIRLGWVKSNEDAKELTQEYFSVFLERDYLKSVEPDRGKFRTYVKTTLKHFLIDVKRKGQTEKRGGFAKRLSFDQLPVEQRDFESGDDPSEAFDREWAKAVLEAGVIKMKESLVAKNKEKYVEVFEEYYDRKLPERLTRKQIAEKLGITEQNVKDYLIAAKNQLSKAVREEIRNYVTDDTQVEPEIKFIFSILK